MDSEGDSISWNLISTKGNPLVCKKCDVPLQDENDLMRHIEHYHKDVWAEHLKALELEKEKQKYFAGN
jgi:hypothetical protein